MRSVAEERQGRVRILIAFNSGNRDSQIGQSIMLLVPFFCYPTLL